MYLTYRDLLNLFPKTYGIMDKSLPFHTVAISSNVMQAKGIFIPIQGSASGELKEAIQNGAIAAIWEEQENIPDYTPNHFPIFYTNDLVKGLMNMIKLYSEQLNQMERPIKDKTKFLFSDKVLLNEIEGTYDIAVIANKLNLFSEQNVSERRG